MSRGLSAPGMCVDWRYKHRELLLRLRQVMSYQDSRGLTAPGAETANSRTLRGLSAGYCDIIDLTINISRLSSCDNDILRSKTPRTTTEWGKGKFY